jgi:HK97 family phage prohead protease
MSTVRIEGYASIFDIPDLGLDIVDKNAFLNINRTVRMLYQHNPHQILGKWTKIEPDKKGLYVVGEIDLSYQCGKTVYNKIKQNFNDFGLSIGFKTRQFEVKKFKNQKKTGRILKDIDLWEVSIVAYPMHPQARILSLDY